MRNKPYIHDDEYYYTIVRVNIRKYRKLRVLTQQNLADITNLSREYICDVEKESRNKRLTISALGKIADALGIDVGNFFKSDN